MATTDISKTQTGVITVTTGGVIQRVYVNPVCNYSFNAAGTILNINLGFEGYTPNLTDLTVQGVAPTDVPGAYAALATAFKTT